MDVPLPSQLDAELCAAELAPEPVNAAARSPQIALTIAGHDPSSGAGITADLMTFAAHDLFGTSCITALTVQSTLGVQGVKALPGEWITRSLRCLEDDLPAAGIKIGMLGSTEAVYAVSDYLREVRRRRPVLVILDPVLRSSSGAALLPAEAFTALREVLLPLCDVVTPNHAELFRLLGRERDAAIDVMAAARALREGIGGRELVVTGGDEPEPEDILLDSRGNMTRISGQRVDTTATHGTGCAFSAALLSYRLRGMLLEDAARAAKRYVEGALRRAPLLGHGNGPMHLLWQSNMSE